MAADGEAGEVRPRVFMPLVLISTWVPMKSLTTDRKPYKGLGWGVRFCRRCECLLLNLKPCGCRGRG